MNWNDFIIGFVGGSILVFMSVSADMIWGSIAIGALLGLMNEGHRSNQKEKDNLQ